MDITEKIELFLGEEISGTPATTTGDIAKVQTKKDVITRKKKKKRKLQSGTNALSGLSMSNP